MPSLRNRREGFALAMAIIAIVVIGTLIASGYFLSTQEFRLGRNTLNQQRAFMASEYGLNREQNGWDKVKNLTMAYGETRTDTFSTGGGTTAIVRVTRLNEYSFWAVSQGYYNTTNRQLGSTRTLNSILRVAYPTFDIKGALTVRGMVEVQGSSKVNGNDSIPDQWKTQSICPPTGANLAGVVAPDTSQVCNGTCPGSSGPDRLFGNPAKLQDPSAADTMTYFKYGDENYNTLVAAADIILPGGNYKPEPSYSGGVCTKTDNMNWGDIYRTTPCGDWFPIIYIKGSLKIQSNSFGQGILIVDGDMEMAGGFEFNGIVIVRDDIKSTGTGNKIAGSVFAGNTYVTDNSSIAGNAEIRYSSCAVNRAAQGASALIRAKQRGWAEMF
jgi:hypothetical protein